jgi:hypothetical protein
MRGKSRSVVRGVLLLQIIFTAGSCTAPLRYNSLDLALLPCEEGDAPVFFRAIEFDTNGRVAFDHQLVELRERLKAAPIVTDLIFFIHGWNKNPSSAEIDYQNFLCRLHARLRTIIGDEKRRGGLLVVGVFWPSTITNRNHEPEWLMPMSYYKIRNRADRIAETGLADLMSSIIPQVPTAQQPSALRLHFIGHSFGARMLVRSFETLDRRQQLTPLLLSAENVNVVLLNAAMPPERFEWINNAVKQARAHKAPARFTEDTASYLFNVHSFNDSANRILFPLASVFNDDPAGCGAGACGVRNYPTVCIDDAGHILKPKVNATASAANSSLNGWNIDSTKIVFSHTDIYKGRVSTLVADLLYNKDSRSEFPNASNSDMPTDTRCQLGSNRQ